MAEEPIKDVKVSPEPVPPALDEKGVPWENRAKENERKLREAEAKIVELEAESVAAEVEPEPVLTQDDKQKKLAEFVEDPDLWYEKKQRDAEIKKQTAQIVPWLKGQEGYAPEDNARLIQIEREHGLRGFPLQIAQASWKILRAEKLEKEVQTLRGERARGTDASLMPDGLGRSVGPAPKVTRDELIAKLALAERKGDVRLSAVLLSQLEEIPRKREAL